MKLPTLVVSDWSTPAERMSRQCRKTLHRLEPVSPGTASRAVAASGVRLWKQTESGRHIDRRWPVLGAETTVLLRQVGADNPGWARGLSRSVFRLSRLAWEPGGQGRANSSASVSRLRCRFAKRRARAPSNVGHGELRELAATARPYLDRIPSARRALGRLGKARAACGRFECPRPSGARVSTGANGAGTLNADKARIAETRESHAIQTWFGPVPSARARESHPMPWH